MIMRLRGAGGISTFVNCSRKSFVRRLVANASRARKSIRYRSSEYQIAMLYFIAGKLEIPYYG
jgi:hypothetical protein